MSYGFPIINFCNHGVHYKTPCILTENSQNETARKCGQWVASGRMSDRQLDRETGGSQVSLFATLWTSFKKRVWNRLHTQNDAELLTDCSTNSFPYTHAHHTHTHTTPTTTHTHTPHTHHTPTHTHTPSTHHTHTHTHTTPHTHTHHTHKHKLTHQ